MSTATTPVDVQTPPPERDGAPDAAPPRETDTRRVLRLRVPAIVQLADRTMSVANVRKLAVGSIIEFDKSVAQELDLLINNRLVGRGNCVRVGEHFGLRLTRIHDPVQRIRSLGKPDE